jgi:CheY-like chemotaxis protein
MVWVSERKQFLTGTSRVAKKPTRASGVILLVEDDPNDVLLVQRAFTRLNIVNSFQVVRDGEEAVDYLSGEGKFADRETYPLPVLVLLDLKLPKKSGLEVLEWLKAQDGLRRLPVVMLTSSRETSDVNRAYDLGVSSYLVKPVTFSALVDLITHVDVYWMLLNERPEVSPG